MDILHLKSSHLRHRKITMTWTVLGKLTPTQKYATPIRLRCLRNLFSLCLKYRPQRTKQLAFLARPKSAGTQQKKIRAFVIRSADKGFNTTEKLTM